jgi:hypothetical protein
MSSGRRSPPAGPRRQGRLFTRARRVVTLAVILASPGVCVCAAAQRAAADEPSLDSESNPSRARTRRIANSSGGGGTEPELELSVELLSAYVFRGYNVFQAERQSEQKWVQRPRILWTAPGTGFSLGYAAANQISGDNLVDNVAAGLGAEQDLFVGYDFKRRSRWGLGTELAVVGYPAAEKSLVGTAVPVYVSVAAEPRYRHNLYLFLGYLRGFRHGPIDGSQAYINPRFEKRIAFGDDMEMELQVGVGMKILQADLGVVADNVFDALATATLYYALNDVFYVGAKMGWAWTNLRPRRDPDTGQTINPGFADEYVPFWGLSLGAEFSSRGWYDSGVSKHRAPTM